MLVPSCEMKGTGLSHDDDWLHRLLINDFQMRLGLHVYSHMSSSIDSNVQ